MNLIEQLYYQNTQDWKKYTSIHLLINHRDYLDKDSPIKEFNEKNIWHYNYTYGDMARSILIKANLWLKYNL
jgi:hypothetical protein